MTAEDADRPPLDAAALAAALAPVPDLALEVVDEAPSTNALAAERARAGAPDGTVVVADHQSSGRGRLDRTWTTPPGTAATFSLVLRPTVPAASWPWLPLLTGHVVAKELGALGYRAALKWPNDVLLAAEGDWRKVAGILVERLETPDGPAAVVGIGLNVSMAADELPVPTATSLALADHGAAAAPPSRTDLVARLVVAMREGVDAWQAGGAQGESRLAASYTAACATVGSEVRVELPSGGSLEGRAVEVDIDGRLVVETPDGRERVGAGDVVHVR